MKIKLWIIIIAFLLYSVSPCYALKDKKLPNGNVEVEASQYIKYVSLMRNQKKKLKEYETLTISLKKVVETQEEELRLLTDSILSYKQTVAYHELIDKQQEDYLKWSDQRITAYRGEVKRLESKPGGWLGKMKKGSFFPLLVISLASVYKNLK